MIHKARIQRLEVVRKEDPVHGTVVTKAECYVSIPRLAGDKHTYGPCQMAYGIFGSLLTGATDMYGGGHNHDGGAWAFHYHEPHVHRHDGPGLAVGDWVWVGFEGGAFDSPVVLARAVHE